MKIYILLAIAFVFASCFKDEGNYTYITLNAIQIDSLDNSYDFLSGDTIRLRPGLKFLRGEMQDLAYSWEINGEKIADTKDLETVYYGEAGSAFCVFSVTDKATGMKYMKQISMTFRPQFQQGWMVLYEEEGKASLDYIRTDRKWNSEVGGWDPVYIDYPHVYKTANREELGGKPIRLVEHWSEASGIHSEILVIQQGGQGSVEIDGNTLLKVVTTQQEFIDEMLPPDFLPQQAVYMANNSYLVDVHGNMYGRKYFTPNDYHSGLYDQTPIYFSRGLSVGQLIPTVYMRTWFMLLWDQQNRRYLRLKDSPYFSDESGELEELPDIDQKGYSQLNDMKMDLVYSDFYIQGHTSQQSAFFSILRDGNRYVMQDFEIMDDYSDYFITINYEEEFPGGYLLNGENLIDQLPRRSYVFLTGGTNQSILYYYDKSTRKIQVYHDFKGTRITALRHSIDRQGATNNHMAVGLENGEFYIFDITDAVLAAGTSKILYPQAGSIPKRGGKIVDILHKLGNKTDFIWQ